MINYLTELKTKLPKEPREFLFGDSEIEFLKDAVKFISIYYVIVRNIDFHPGEERPISRGVPPIQIINKDHKTIVLSDWFKKRLIQRISGTFKKQLEFFFKYGFDLHDMTDILFITPLSYKFKPSEPANFNWLKIQLDTGIEKFPDCFEKISLILEKQNKNALINFFSTLSIPMFDLFLTVVSDPPLLSMFEKKNAEKIDDEYCNKIFEKWQYNNFHFEGWEAWYQRRHSDDKSLLAGNNYIPMEKRICLDGQSLKLGFYRNNGSLIWYAVNVDGSVKYTLTNGKSIKSRRYHFSLHGPKKAYNILDQFRINVNNNLSKHEMKYHNKVCRFYFLDERIHKITNKFKKSRDFKENN